MADLNGKTDVFRVVYVGDAGEGQMNVQALVFQEPVQGKEFKADQMWMLPGATAAPTNDEGVIPHREPSGVEGEDLGVTWHYQK